MLVVLYNVRGERRTNSRRGEGGIRGRQQGVLYVHWRQEKSQELTSPQRRYKLDIRKT